MTDSDPAGELRRLNWAVRAYARCSSALIRPHATAQLMSNVCEAIVESDAYLLAFVGLLEPPPGRAVRIEARAGAAAEYANGLVLSGNADHPAGNGATGRAIRAGMPMIIGDSALDPTYSYWRERGRQFGVRSSVTVPFKRGSAVVGILNVYGAQPNAFGGEEMALFEQLGQELAFALDLAEERARLEVASIAHELGQPLTAIKTSNATALRWLALDPPNVAEAQSALLRTARDIERAVGVVSRTRALVMKGAPAEHVAFDLNDAVSEVLQIVSERLRTADVVARVDLSDALAPVHGDRIQIQQVALNLALNSLDAMLLVDSRPRRIVVRRSRTTSP